MKEGALHELPGGWVWTSLEEVCLYPQYGWTTSAKTEGALYLLRTTDITSGNIDWNTVPFCKEEPSEKEKYLLKDGDILISRAGSVGYSHLIKNPKKAIFASYLIRFRPLIDEKYLAYFLKSPIYWISISEKSLGIAIPNVNASKLKQIPLPLPPLPEQRAIVSKIEQLFSDLDNGIENFKKAQAQLKLYRQSVLKAACEGELVPTEAELARAEGREYEAADVLLARILKVRCEKWNGKGKYKEAEAPEVSGMPTLPKGWIWANIDQLSEVVRGASPRPAGHPKYFGGNIPWITVGEITKDKKIYLTSVENFVTEEGKKASRFLEEGTFLLTNSGATLGVPKITLISGCINDGSVALLGLDETLKLYLYFFLFTQTNKLRQINQGAAQPNLNTTIVKRIILPLPPHSEQRRIVNAVERRLSVSDKMEETITESLQKAESLRQSILKKAFEGKLLNKKELEKARNAPDWEPAEKLLKRIKAEKMNIKNG